jgi:aspartokinase
MAYKVAGREDSMEAFGAWDGPASCVTDNPTRREDLMEAFGTGDGPASCVTYNPAHRDDSMEDHVTTDVMLCRDVTRMRVVVRDERRDGTGLIEVLDENGVHANIVDLACDATHPACVVITLLLRGSDVPRAQLLIYEYLDGVRDCEIACDHGLAMVSIQGFGISSDLAAVASIMRLLGRRSIGVHELSTSENRIDFFVDPDSADLAASVLNQELGGQGQAA